MGWYLALNCVTPPAEILRPPIGIDGVEVRKNSGHGKPPAQFGPPAAWPAPEAIVMPLMYTSPLQVLYAVNCCGAVAQSFFTLPKSYESGTTVRHTGPIEACTGTVTCGLVGEATLKCSAPVSVCVVIGTAVIGHTRTTMVKTSPGC